MNKILVIFEMANNHMGDIGHGKLMIEKFSNVAKSYADTFDFAWKFQFRDFDTFIHKDYKDRMDLKYVKRFTETILSKEQFVELKAYAEQLGFKTLCTGFDENSVSLIEEMKFDVIKVASCSFTDWPLLNRVATINAPIILSTAGATLEDIDKVVSFMQHRNKNISLMHCVGEYPTPAEDLQLNQINILQNRYPTIPIGYSTHEEPSETDAIQVAIGKGILLTEKHVAVQTEQYPPNAYSVTPEQMNEWLQKAKKALIMCGTNKRVVASEKELSDLLQFKRGAFAKRKLTKGMVATRDDFYFSWPNIPSQILANDCSKYNQYLLTADIEQDAAVTTIATSKEDTREQIWKIVQDVKSLLSTTGVVYPGKAELEISHHYGIEKFYEVGITMITVVNREYCKKLIIMLPNQMHPEQYHLQKEETFVVLYGEVDLTLNGKSVTLTKGDVVTIEREMRHIFSTKTGCVIEEVSSTHYKNDSYYTDDSIAKNKNRKTLVTHWL